MDIYLSSPDADEFFFKAVVESVQVVGNVHGEGQFRLIYPPRKLPKDLGRVDSNFAQLLSCDLVILNISPESLEREVIYNPGVMIEYGMVFASEGTSWKNLWPPPAHKVYCHDKFHRMNLTPPLGLESVESYAHSEEGYKPLVDSITGVLQDRVRLRLTETGTIPSQGQPYAATAQGPWRIVSVSGLVTGQ